jgi:hypothetical protein
MSVRRMKTDARATAVIERRSSLQPWYGCSNGVCVIGRRSKYVNRAEEGAAGRKAHGCRVILLAVPACYCRTATKAGALVRAPELRTLL